MKRLHELTLFERVFHVLIPNAPQVDEMHESSPTVPEGHYNLRVHKAEFVAKPKEGKNPYVKVQYVITGPEGTKALGRMIFQNYMLQGDGTFRTREMLTVTGHDASFRLEDTDQLIGLELTAAVIEKPGTQGYGPKNEIKKHFVLGYAPPQTVQTV